MSVPVFFSQSDYRNVDTSYYSPNYGNYKFDTDLTNFGVMKERKFRKVNRVQSILKLREVKDIKSIYPMIDEFGYSFSDFFIFKSTWDLEYSIETVLSKPDTTFKKDMTQYSKEKFLGKHLSNPDRVIEEWQQANEFSVGRPPIDINKINYL